MLRDAQGCSGMLWDAQGGFSIYSNAARDSINLFFFYFFGFSAVVLNDLGCSGMLRDASGFIQTLPEIQ